MLKESNQPSLLQKWIEIRSQILELVNASASDQKECEEFSYCLKVIDAKLFHLLQDYGSDDVFSQHVPSYLDLKSAVRPSLTSTFFASNQQLSKIIDDKSRAALILAANSTRTFIYKDNVLYAFGNNDYARLGWGIQIGERNRSVFICLYPK
jgi:hypothetical protein